MTAADGAGAPKRIAQIVVEGFDESYRRFRDLAAHAKERFEDADWPAVQDAVRERLRAGDEHVARTAAQVCAELGPECLDVAAWRRAKLETTVLLVDHKRPELAETFFNSGAADARPALRRRRLPCSCRRRSRRSTSPPTIRPTGATTPRAGLEAIFAQILRDYGWRHLFADLGAGRRARDPHARASRRPAPSRTSRRSARPASPEQGAYVVARS
jgi:isocitrate dehydrogenase kinase/phosphatase